MSLRLGTLRLLKVQGNHVPPQTSPPRYRYQAEDTAEEAEQERSNKRWRSLVVCF